ncbi:MAG: hypothetical protein R2788_03525 [Saprospiraceae bacterium]
MTDNCGADLPIFMTEDTISYTCPDTYTFGKGNGWCRIVNLIWYLNYRH